MQTILDGWYCFVRFILLSQSDLNLQHNETLFCVIDFGLMAGGIIQIQCFSHNDEHYIG